MPKIRSITTFVDLTPDVADATIARMGAFLEDASQAFAKTGYQIQTRRMATQPFSSGLAPDGPESVPQLAAEFFALCQSQNINYLSLGPVRLQDDPRYIEVIGEIFRRTSGVFATVSIAEPDQGISLLRLWQTAVLIDRVSRITPDGMTNLYLAALANCPPGSPFFPVAYHGAGPAQFALAIQAADIAVWAFSKAATPAVARERLIGAIQSTVDQLVPVAEALAEKHGIGFGGFDFSLAPYPVDAESLGGALEALGPSFGGAGLVASAALVMNAVESANFPRAGFCGLMLPILEDSVLAARAAEGRLTVNDLLLLSAVCGTGLDCIPLPGEVGIAALHDILLDVAALALRLDKPLTARLMPFPEKQAGDMLEFEFEFFAGSRVLAGPVSTTRPNSALGQTGPSPEDLFQIKPRPKR
ncbi:MAG: DUF711 family protein [Chloroflexi bacterium]|nr:DUF711 family protein [Chloroflexota bacterium]